MPKIIPDEQIYEATIQAVIERGYTGATTRQIAQAAGISEVTLFRKYGSKTALVQQAILNTAVQMNFSTAAQYTGDVTADLARVVQAYQDLSAQHGQFILTLIAEISRHPQLGELLDAPLSLMIDVGALLGRYMEAGVLKPEPPLQAVTELLGPLMIANLVRQAKADAPLPPLDAAQHVALFLHGRQLTL